MKLKNAIRKGAWASNRLPRSKRHSPPRDGRYVHVANVTAHRVASFLQLLRVFLLQTCCRLANEPKSMQFMIVADDDRASSRRASDRAKGLRLART